MGSVRDDVLTLVFTEQEQGQEGKASRRFDQ